MRMLYTPVFLATIYVFLNTRFIFENLDRPTPYTIGTKYSPKLATSTIFVKSASIFLQIRYKDKPSLITSRSTIKSRFIHLLLVLLLSGQVKLNPGPVTPNQSSTLSTKYPCGVFQKKVKDSYQALLCGNVNYGFTLIAWIFLFQIIPLYLIY